VRQLSHLEFLTALLESHRGWNGPPRSPIRARQRQPMAGDPAAVMASRVSVKDVISPLIKLSFAQKFDYFHHGCLCYYRTTSVAYFAIVLPMSAGLSTPSSSTGSLLRSRKYST